MTPCVLVRHRFVSKVLLFCFGVWTNSAVVARRHRACPSSVARGLWVYRQLAASYRGKGPGSHALLACRNAGEWRTLTHLSRLPSAPRTGTYPRDMVRIVCSSTKVNIVSGKVKLAYHSGRAV